MATAVTNNEQVDIDALAVDATKRQAVLEEQRSRLALDALSDPQVTSELESVESELASCKAVLERVELARTEKSRLEALAAAERLRASREDALREARELQGDVERESAAFDRWAASCPAVRWLERLDEQDAALARAGKSLPSNRFDVRASLLERAFRFGMRGLPRGVLVLEGMALSRPQSLVESAPRPVDPIKRGKVS